MQETLAQGADLVAFSGDKLLGGPQAGLIVGRKDLIQRLRKNPMTRALRLDKLIIAALEATLRLYGDAEHARRQIPTLRLLTRPESEIAALAHRLQPTVAAACADCATVSVQACASQIGSGALPVDRLPSAALRLQPAGLRRGAGRALDTLAAGLRALPVPVVGRVADGALWLDLRCLDDEAGLAGQLRRAAPPGAARGAPRARAAAAALVALEAAPWHGRGERVTLRGRAVAAAIATAPVLVLGGVWGALKGCAVGAMGAMGAVGAIVLAALNKRLSWTLVRQAMESTMRITAMVIFILIGSTVFSLVFQGVDGGIWIEHMLTSMTGGDPRTFLIIVNIFVFFLAFFLDFFEIAFIIIPLLAPVAAKLGIDLVWFGVLLCVNMQTSFMHPPFGFALFYLRGIAPKEIKSSDIYLGAIPWVVMQLLLVAILIFYPGMVTNFLDKPVNINTENIQMDITSEEPAAGASSEKSEPNNDPFAIKKD